MQATAHHDWRRVDGATPGTSASPVLSDRTEGGVRGVATVREPDTVLAEHAHSHATVALLLEGGVTERCGHRNIRIPPPGGMYKPAGEPHENRYGPDGAREVIFSFQAPDVEGPARAAATLTGTALARTLAAAAAFRDGSRFFALQAEEALAESAHPANGGPVPSAARQVERVRSLVHEEFMPPPSLDLLADLSGVARGHLTRLFRATYGCSIGEYARRRQIAVAVESLRCGETLGQTALAAGFFDQSHMTRALRRTLGTTPGRLARLLGPYRLPPPDSDDR